MHLDGKESEVAPVSTNASSTVTVRASAAGRRPLLDFPCVFQILNLRPNNDATHLASLHHFMLHN